MYLSRLEIVIKTFTTKKFKDMQDDSFQEDSFWQDDEILAKKFLTKTVMMKFPKDVRNEYIKEIYQNVPNEDALNNAMERYAKKVKCEVCFFLGIESHETDILIEFIPAEDDVYDDRVMHEIHINNEPKSGIHKMWKILSSNSKKEIDESILTMMYMDGLLPHSIEDSEKLVDLAFFAYKRVFRVSESPDMGHS